MRHAGIAALLALALLLGPVTSPTGAHEGLEHLDLEHRTLPPGGSSGADLSFRSRHLQAGWLFVVNGRVANGTGPVDVELVLRGDPVRTWSWTAGPWYADTAILPETADYNLTFRNPSSEVVEVEFFFDQSCECLGKLIPAPGGVVIFQADLSAGERMRVTFETRDGLADAQVDLARLRPGGETWPDDFDVIRTIRTGLGQTVLDFTASSTARHYLITTALEGSGLVVPHLEVVRPSPEPVPVGVWVLGLVAAGIGVQLAYVALRRRQRP